ncbi:l-2-hydroxyglutarate mitochondrial precursor [Grosmannia clavigera kw1407]|uniref:L-2-hydroxyglutarate mitochondrial n=1 Tax=Grosmannia clavigera (strain kw1407 / UAMH 11150) TaxID=655863 RepID=F0XUL4_GROCL|nr:l-2-hydroxyglutarate mitochondrial precursor [Grosmannia clavigera kw1407]EFW98773.1 l-2-hydroxyglutarate mitochondrial precursor [Grosmannia clavigera kw1407]
MAVKDEDACYPTNSLIAKESRRHYRTRITPIHWQLRSLIGVSRSNKVYYPTGTDNLHIQEFNTATKKSETIALLSFSPRCLVARGGWVCCGGEEGEFVAIRVEDRSRRVRNSAHGRVRDDSHHRSHSRAHGRRRSDSVRAVAGGDDGDGSRSMDDEDYDDFDLRMGEPPRAALVTVPSRFAAKSQKFGKERVNCITIWFPSLMMALAPGAYKQAVVALANNDKHVTLVSLDEMEELDELSYPDCVNRAVLSPDGRFLAAVSDDPYLYIHERVKRDDEVPPPTRRRTDQPPVRSSYVWKLLARHHLRDQDKNDRTVHRGSFAACFSNTGRYLAVGTQYGTISIFDTALLGEPGDTSLVACFTSSSPKADAGAVREMSFCPGPYDLLAWSEDYGAVGIADARNKFAARQIIKLGDESAFERIAINQTTHVNDELVEERQRRHQRQRQDGEDTGGRGDSMPRFRNGDYGVSSEEQALRIRDALDRYHLPLTAEETQFLDALQLRRDRDRRLQREQREAQAQREQRETELLARPSAWILRSRPGLADGGSSRNNNGSGNGNDGSSGTSRTRDQGRDRDRDRGEGVTVSDVLSSIRSLRSAREQERRNFLRTQGLLQAAMQTPAIPTIENEESGTDDDELTVPMPVPVPVPVPVTTTAHGQQRRRLPWGSLDAPLPNFGTLGERGDARTIDFLHAYTVGNNGGAEAGSSSNNNGGSGSGNGSGTGGVGRRERGALPGSSLLSQTMMLDWDTGIVSMSRRAREPATSSEQKDGHTAGLVWSEDGTIFRAESGRVDECLGDDGELFSLADRPHVDGPTATAVLFRVAERADPHHWRAERDRATSLLEAALQRRHQAMTVDDAGRQALEHAGVRPHGRLAALGLGRAHPAERQECGVVVVPAVLSGRGVDALQCGELGGRLGHQPLARAAMRHAVRGTKVVQQPAAADAELRLERVGAVVEAGVDDLAVARGCLRADGGVAFEHEDG